MPCHWSMASLFSPVLLCPPDRISLLFEQEHEIVSEDLQTKDLPTEDLQMMQSLPTEGLPTEELLTKDALQKGSKARRQTVCSVAALCTDSNMPCSPEAGISCMACIMPCDTVPHSW